MVYTDATVPLYVKNKTYNYGQRLVSVKDSIGAAVPGHSRWTVISSPEGSSGLEINQDGEAELASGINYRFFV